MSAGRSRIFVANGRNAEKTNSIFTRRSSETVRWRGVLFRISTARRDGFVFGDFVTFYTHTYTPNVRFSEDKTATGVGVEFGLIVAHRKHTDRTDVANSVRSE